ncbi:MAG: glycosyltransferase [Desulfuromonadales bacterium]
MNSNLITMITICRNAETTIAHTIKSVKNQQFRRLEYIVIDGASTDSTVNIVRSFGKSIDKLVSEPDNGIADAFNKGIAQASGSIIGFINADDQMLPGSLNKVASMFDRYPEIEVLHGDIFLYDCDKFVKQIAPPYRWWYPWRLVLFNHPATFVRRNVYERLGSFDTSYRYSMDDELYLRWVQSGVIVRYLPEPLVRMQTGGASGINTTQVFIEKRRALLAHGYPYLLVELQFICRFAVQVIAIMQSKWRMFSSSRMDSCHSISTFERHSQQGIDINCPSCSNPTSEVLYRYLYRDQFSYIYHCRPCSLEFLRPLPLTQIEERQMDSIDDAELFSSGLFQSLHKKLVIAPEISRVQKLLGRSDYSMLDVGCGTGWISKIWADSGARVTGLEPSAARAAVARKRGIRVLSCYAEELDDDEKYDLIVIRHVVEHLEDPKVILRGFVSRLNTNGVLLIVVPNH